MSSARCLRRGTLLLVAMLGRSLALGEGPGPAPLSHEAYVWQRAWTPSVIGAVRDRATNFTALMPLHAEVSGTQPRGRVMRVPLDFTTLRRAGCRIGLALRIGPYPGPFGPQDARTLQLADLAASLVREASSNGVSVAELHLDFDCAESRLAGYQLWVEVIRARVRPVAVVITALPSWLRHAGFASLAAAADGYVLQVHSLQRPEGVDRPFQLCDPREARAALARAAVLGRPFWVALPTYGYQVAFDGRGRFIGLSADGPTPRWPEDTQLREVRADPREMAALVSEWMSARPPAMRGVIWYRLPIPHELLNWPWATLSTVMSGHVPAAALRVETRRSAAGLIELDLVNQGSASWLQAARVRVHWRDGQWIAGDGLNGYELSELDARTVRLASEHARVDPGERRPIGWMRFADAPNPRLEIELEYDH
jgi:hypothetical protein